MDLITVMLSICPTGNLLSDVFNRRLNYRSTGTRSNALVSTAPGHRVCSLPRHGSSARPKHMIENMDTESDFYQWPYPLFLYAQLLKALSSGLPSE